MGRLIGFFIENKLFVLLLIIGVVFGGILVAPFDWSVGDLPRSPVPVDAIPDIGENQQIVFTNWPGRSPQDVEDQITYPLSAVLLGLPGVKTIRSYSMFGFSTIYVIFNDDIEFYWSRTRVLEKLSSLPIDTIPDGVRPALGPDATPLGQIFWYTLEGKDEAGKPAGGWGLEELRAIQDWHLRYELLSVPGVAEVASVGGFVQEYHVELSPLAMRTFGVTINQVAKALQNSNIDVGARTMEVNRVEYVIRGLGFVKKSADLEQAVVAVKDNVPVRVKDVAKVTKGPALRRGALDKGGEEAVGGVVVVRYGENPLTVIKRVRQRINDIAQSLPVKEHKGKNSRVTIVPFYDRTGLINETLGTLDKALSDEILVTIVVVVLMLWHLSSSLLISGLLPLAVALCFITMRLFRIDANVVALSGIAIAIGTMVDMGIVLNENILRHLADKEEEEPAHKAVHRAAVEVGSAVLTAVSTTVISFLPVFTMEAAEGKLFKPLAYTKTFALIASLVVALIVIPPFASFLFPWRLGRRRVGSFLRHIGNILSLAIVFYFLTSHWMPLGYSVTFVNNLIFVVSVVGGLLLLFFLFHHYYEGILRFCLAHKLIFLLLPTFLVLFGVAIWQGFDTLNQHLPQAFQSSSFAQWASKTFPGLGKEFMPKLDEGAFLLMPTTMPHASIGECMDVLRKQDMAMEEIPEVTTVVGKIGRVDSSLDPAPISMVETVINYKSEYLQDTAGHILTFAWDGSKNSLFSDLNGVPVNAPDGKPYLVKGNYLRRNGRLIPQRNGRPFRLWRPSLNPAINPGRKAWPGIKKADDIWNEIIRVTEIPGTTSAPKLQPIETRIVMLQSGMRAPMGVKIYGKGSATLHQLEAVGLAFEKLLKEVPSVRPATVNAERIVGKPYLELNIDRQAIARFGLNVKDVLTVLQSAVGGRQVTTTVEGRERYAVRIRYQRELRDSLESLVRILVPTKDGPHIPLEQLLVGKELSYRRGPMVIKSEDGALVSYVIFDKVKGAAEVNVVEECAAYLAKKIRNKELVLPPGVSYSFAGTFENQVRSEKKLKVVLPIALLIIVLILYLQFRRLSTTLFVFSGIVVAWSGGFILMWLYGQSWFCDIAVFGVSMREVFQMAPVNLSVAVWVGFIALFGIATDDGVVMATYLEQLFDSENPQTIEEIREATVKAALRRVRPCLMTTATTILALLPVLSSTGKGSDIMVPMSIPVAGGMTIELVTMFVVPVLYCGLRELQSPRA